MEVECFAMSLHPPGSKITQTLDNDLRQLATLDKLSMLELIEGNLKWHTTR